MYAYELVARGRDVEVRLLLVHEEGVWHPDVLDELGSHGQGLDTRPLPKREPRVRPELTEVEIQREVLWEKEKQVRGGGSVLFGNPRSGGGRGQVSRCRQQKTLSVIKFIYRIVFSVMLQGTAVIRHHGYH
jgi:hypothetical protein